MHKSAHTVVFLICTGILVLIVGIHNFTRYYIMRDYPLNVFSSCDPAMHSCFIANPDTADPTFQTEPYEKVAVDAAHAPSCLDEHTCSNFTCEGVGGTCEVTYCSADTVEEGESCSNASP